MPPAILDRAARQPSLRLHRRGALAALAGAALAACVPGRASPGQPSAPRGGTPAALPNVTVRISAGRPLRKISPLIYGVAAAQADDLQALRPRLHRWGGNPSSRYNWELGNAWNAARDFEFRNGNFGNTRPGDQSPSGAADRFVTEARAAGAEPLISVPALGWVARDDSSETRSRDVPRGGSAPPNGGDGDGGVPGYDPSANRGATSVRSVARKNAPFADPPDRDDGVVYQDEWIHHLVQRFGSASRGGVRYYAIDNEPDLWSETHTDVRPARPSYDEVLERFLEYATAIKAVDPDAKVLGPAVSGWTGYLYSALDRGADNFAAHADRRAHGDMPFLPWFLDQVRKHDERAGKRTLDLLDVHFYPQGQNVFSPATDATTNALRLRSTRALWDPGYSDESWIKEPVQLLPRLRGWADQYYPGTQIGIGEWNWGAEQSINGALAAADVLGILGRDGADLAAYWTVPPRGSPTALAFTLFTNVDGRGAGFGDEALGVNLGNSVVPEDLAVYASRDTTAGACAVVALNKSSSKSLTAALLLEDVNPKGPARAYQVTEGLSAIRDLGPVPLSGRQVVVTLPPSSITHVRVTL